MVATFEQRDTNVTVLLGQVTDQAVTLLGGKEKTQQPGAQPRWGQH
jgi:hypothetical protein